MVLKNHLLKLEGKFATLILGAHPRNTIFSFNYHNVTHIIHFLKSKRVRLGSAFDLVDIGAGSSPYFYLFKDQAASYIAIDNQGSLPKKEQRNILQKFGFAEELPLESSTLDVVLCNQVLEHVLNAEQAVSEMYRVLKPGGYIIGSVPHISPVHLEPYDFRRFTDLGLHKLLDDNGFVEIEIEGNGSIYRAAAFLLAMDWMLSSRSKNKKQVFSVRRALVLSPIVALLNVVAILIEKLVKNKNRSSANLCWIAKKRI